MLQHRGIQNFEQFEKSIRSFANFYPRIKGASDIDFFYERKGNFLILEDKTYNSQQQLLLYYGEMKALLSFWNLSDKITGFICAHDENYEDYVMINFSRINMKNMSKNEKGVWCMHFDCSEEPVITMEEVIELVGLECDKYETLKNSKKKGLSC